MGDHEVFAVEAQAEIARAIVVPQSMQVDWTGEPDKGSAVHIGGNTYLRT
jgi:hypothetical protein